MKAPVSWLREVAGLPSEVATKDLAAALTRAGLQVEHSSSPAESISGDIVVGRVLEFSDEPQHNGKIIRWCQVDVGAHNPEGKPARGIVCGAHNFVAGDYVPVALAGSVLPGGFAIEPRKTYGHISDGMICAADELGIGEDHTGIIVLAADPAPVVGTDALELLGARDEIFEIDVTPDLGYCLSIRGLARETAQAYGLAFNDPYQDSVPDASADGYPVRLDSDACPLFVALRVHDVDPHAPTPEWMARRLVACGMRSISLGVDITNYVMLESGQPLHAYDATLLQGPIVVRQAQEGEHITTLDGVDRTLSSGDLLITDDSGPIGMAGVMGGMTTEIVESTSEILIEAAHFDPATIGRTFRAHQLLSEASRRFERGVDAGVAYAAALRTAQLLVELGGGHLDPAITVAGAVPAVPTQTMRAALPGEILGLELDPEIVVAKLVASGVQVDYDEPLTGESVLRLRPPTWRRDLVDKYDYIEDVGCKVGYDQIPVTVPRASLGTGYTAEQRYRRAVIEAVAAAGFTEVISLPFSGSADLDRLQLPPDDSRRALVTLANPLADTAPGMRTTLLGGLLSAINRNTSRSLTDLALFECGSVFWDIGRSASPSPDVTQRPSDPEIETLFNSLPEQPRMLAGVVCGDWRPAGWAGAAVPADWTQVVWFAEVAAEAVGVPLVRRSAAQAPWHPGRCAEVGVRVAGAFNSIGFAGELHPSVCQAWGVPDRTCAVELNLSALIAAAPGPGTITPLSSFPLTKQDVALIVDTEMPAAVVADALRRGGGELLESISLFDVYVGDQIGAGKKSLAFSLHFRAQGRTLTDEDATQARNQAVALAALECGAVLRGE